MKKFILIIFAACLLSVFYIGCKKDSNSSKSPSANALFSGAWKLTKYELVSSSGSFVAFTPPLSYGSNDLTTFKSDGTYVVTSGGLQSYTGNWSAYNNGKNLDFNYTSYDVELLNSSTLILDHHMGAFQEQVNGSIQTFYGERYTYTH